MFCPNCGNQIDEKAIICLKCGVATDNSNPTVGTCDWLTTLLLCFFLGSLGVHSFYAKKTGIGIFQLLTLGGCGIWVLVDFIMILSNGYKDGNGNALVRK
jgi:TM2 domain-containing membrane protein YozV